MIRQTIYSLSATSVAKAMEGYPCRISIIRSNIPTTEEDGRGFLRRRVKSNCVCWP